MPDHPTPEDPMAGFVSDATGRGMPVDAGTIEIAAVGAGPEVRELRGRRRRGKGLGIAGWLSVGWIALVVGLALLAPVLPIDDPREPITSIARRGPLADAGTAPGHLLGGDGNGRDMLSRLIWGGRTTLLVATLAVAIGLVFGGALGLIGGYYRGKVDVVVSGLLDVFLAIPAVILALALVVILRTDPSNPKAGGLDPTTALILAIGLVSIPVLGRITRASTLAWSEREFVTAARAQGARHRRVIVREVLPNVMPAMVSIALLSVAVAIVAEGTLSILGASVEADTPTWGNMIALGRIQLQRAPHVVFEPALMIFFTVLALNMLGDVVRSRFDVREGGLS
ncbi:MAG: ABC transporter permease [Acidimicrobiia bacterium]